MLVPSLNSLIEVMSSFYKQSVIHKNQICDPNYPNTSAVLYFLTKVRVWKVNFEFREMKQRSSGQVDKNPQGTANSVLPHIQPLCTFC